MKSNSLNSSSIYQVKTLKEFLFY